MVNGNRSELCRARHLWIGLILMCMLLGSVAPSRPTLAQASNTPTVWLPLITTRPGLPGDVPEFKHIFTIVLENKGYIKMLEGDEAPYFQSLAQQYGLAESYYGIQHPSLPNYLALIGGDTFGINENCTDCLINAPTIVDQFEAAGISWKAYMESMPTPCFVGDKGSLYQQKHNPFIYFTTIRNNPARCNRIVPFTEFASDLQANTLPSYVWITPNMCNDMHDCAIKTGDAWLRTWVSQIMASPAWQDRGVLFITFDEGELDDNSGCCQYGQGGHLATLVISPLGKPGYRSQTLFSHYSLLRTIEDSWGLPPLGKANCDCSLPMADFFEAALR
jgi:phosphatidylinositol-3-phosphatase